MTMRFMICTILFVSLAAGCKPPADTDTVIPEGILHEDQLVPLLTDCYLAESAAGINVLNVPGTKYDSAYVFNPLKDHHVPKAQFDSTLSFYSKHPKLLKGIYDKVLEKLSQVQATHKVQ